MVTQKITPYNGQILSIVQFVLSDVKKGAVKKVPKKERQGSSGTVDLVFMCKYREKQKMEKI